MSSSQCKSQHWRITKIWRDRLKMCDKYHTKCYSLKLPSRRGSFCSPRGLLGIISLLCNIPGYPVVSVTMCLPSTYWDPSPCICHLGTALWSLHDWQDQCLTFTSEWEVGGRGLPALHGGPWVIWENSPATWPNVTAPKVTRWGDQLMFEGGGQGQVVEWDFGET